eukprot:TRINITY_DN4368_c3_g1_i1.p1 TRINITY_DN4368_c3_g1~~TRINITY_DN4368_c3_g1_i1.p1  ORF type:complete len:1707 (+),score=577.14 TRINITY_DN4368_c3_g1_i1:368-5122(+)
MLVAWLDGGTAMSDGAVHCGLALLSECGNHTFCIDADGHPLECRMALHIGGAHGQVTALVVGGAGVPRLGYWKYVLTGKPVEECGVAANLGSDGQLVVLASMAGGVGTPLSGKVRGQDRDFAMLVAGSKPAAVLLVTPTGGGGTFGMDPESLRLTAAVFSFDTLLHAMLRGGGGELRTVSTVFVQLTGLDCVQTDPQTQLRLLGHAVRTVQRALETGDGVLNKVMMDDKGVICLCLFGIPHHTHEDDAARALAFAQRVRKKLSSDLGAVSIGISRASVYCGLTGSHSRHEYTVLGDGVNIAARLMCKAAEVCQEMRGAQNTRHVMCDEETASGRGASQVGVAFCEGGDIMLKGQETPTHIFHVVADKDREAFEARLRGEEESDGRCSSISSGSSCSSRSSRSSFSSQGSLRQRGRLKGHGRSVSSLLRVGESVARLSMRGRPTPQAVDTEESPRGLLGAPPMPNRASSMCSSSSKVSTSSQASAASGKSKVRAVGRSVVALLKDVQVRKIQRRTNTMTDLLGDDAPSAAEQIPCTPVQPVSCASLLSGRGRQGRTRGDCGGCSEPDPLSSPRESSVRSEHTELVGREAEIGAMHSLLAGGGVPLALNFVGAPGSGKTALVRKLEELAAAEMVAVVIRGAEQAAGEQFGAIRESFSHIDLGRVARSMAGTSLDPYVPLLSHVRRHSAFADTPQSARLSAGDRALKTFDVLLGAIAAHYGPRPCILLCDDVQWLDPFSSAFVAHAVAAGWRAVLTSREESHRTDTTRTSVFGALRVNRERTKSLSSRSSSEDAQWVELQPDAALSCPQLKTLLADPKRCETMHLQNLTDDQCGSLLCSLWRTREVAPAVTKAVFDKTMGVPGHVSDIAVALQEAKVVVTRLGKAQLAVGAEIDEQVVAAVPSIESTVMRAVDFLSPDLRRSLSLAAVLGTSFCESTFATCYAAESARRSIAVPGATASGPEEGARAALRELVAAEFLVRVDVPGSAAVVVRHTVPLRRDAIYSSVLARDRRRLHATAARVIAAGGALPPGCRPHAELAVHWRRANALGQGWRDVSQAYKEAMERGDAAAALLNVADLVSFADKLDGGADGPAAWAVDEWRVDASVCLYEVDELATAVAHVSRIDLKAPTTTPLPAPKLKRRRRWCCCFGGGAAGDDSSTHGSLCGVVSVSSPDRATLQRAVVAQAGSILAELHARLGNGAALQELEQRLSAGGLWLVNEAGFMAATNRPPGDAAVRAQGVEFDTVFDVIAHSRTADSGALSRAVDLVMERTALGSLRPRPATRLETSNARAYTAVAAPSRPSVTHACVAARTALRLLAGDGRGAAGDAAWLAGVSDLRWSIVGHAAACIARVWYNAGSSWFAARGRLLEAVSLHRLSAEATAHGLGRGSTEVALLAAAQALELTQRTGHALREVSEAADLCLDVTVVTAWNCLALITAADAASRTPAHRLLLAAIAPSVASHAEAFPLIRPAAHYIRGKAEREEDAVGGHWARCMAAAEAERMPKSPHAVLAAAAVAADRKSAPECLRAAHRFACAASGDDPPSAVGPTAADTSAAVGRAMTRCGMRTEGSIDIAAAWDFPRSVSS